MLLRPTQSLCAPFRVAIVGSGPSGFYAAARILSNTDAKSIDDVQVHMYERLPIPNGLVRWGVAPDHLDVKNVENRFNEIGQDPRFHFFGNVNVTADDGSPSALRSRGYAYPRANKVSLSRLAGHYTHILLAYGCSESRPLGIPGSSPGDLRNVHSALDFVNWYNGHPAAHDGEFLKEEPWRAVDVAGLHHMSVIGAGNVALDVARIVLRASQGGSASQVAREELLHGDIPEPVIEHLSRSKIADVDINARRGPAQVAFTNKELREMLALPGIALNGIDAQLIKTAEEDVMREEEKFKQAAKSGELEPEFAAEEAGKYRVRKRLLGLLAKGSKTKASEADKRWSLNFFRAPVGFEGRDGRVSSIKWARTSVRGTPLPASSAGGSTPAAAWADDSTARSARVAAEASQTPPSGSNAASSSTNFSTSVEAVVCSVGYKGSPLDSTSQAGMSQDERASSSSADALILPWDSARGIIPNAQGRVQLLGDAELQPSVYVAGWLASGPVGVIASTMRNAYTVADSIVEDFLEKSGRGHGREINTSSPLSARGGTPHKIVSWKDWQRIDHTERERGKQLKKEREKILSVQEMLRVVS